MSVWSCADVLSQFPCRTHTKESCFPHSTRFLHLFTIRAVHAQGTKHGGTAAAQVRASHDLREVDGQSARGEVAVAWCGRRHVVREAARKHTTDTWRPAVCIRRGVRGEGRRGAHHPRCPARGAPARAPCRTARSRPRRCAAALSSSQQQKGKARRQGTEAQRWLGGWEGRHAGSLLVSVVCSLSLACRSFCTAVCVAL